MAVLLLLLLPGCVVTRWTPELLPPDSIPAEGSRAPLKVHLATGDLIVLTDWMEDAEARTLRGHGTRYDARRDLVGSGSFVLHADSVALVETQVADPAVSLRLTAFAAYATLATALTVRCVVDPKSCFGSCPTFYLDGDQDSPQAEGFSRSVARALEERDLDALYQARPAHGRLTLTMRNEALETQAVRGVQLLAVARPAGGRVFATRRGEFFPAPRVTRPARCRSPEGDCLDQVLAMDGRDRASTTDSTDLGALEVVELEFPAPSGGRVGLVVGARHTLVSTHIFYAMLSFMGREAASWLAALERGALREMPPLFGALQRLGEMRVLVQDGNGVWRVVGTFDEAGPLATDVQLVPLPAMAGDEPVRVRLEITRGFWRLDYLALAELGDPVLPRVLTPSAVRVRGRADPAASAALLDSARHLMTYPGDEYQIEFRLPQTGADQEFFLASEGFYYEWMRREWLAEEDPVRAFQLLFQPELALREMAGPFKRVEAEMEELFWNSRFRR